MADLHIDDFNRDCALILLQLYNAFPRPYTVYVEDIAGSDTPDEVGLHSDRHMACLGAMLWLADEGFIRYQALVYQDAIDQAILTRSAYTLLTTPHTKPDLKTTEGSPPERALIHEIRQQIKSGTSDQINTCMLSFFAQQPLSIQPDL